MEVIIPSNNLDFDFNSARSSPVHVGGVPSTPKRFGEYYFSAPTSPSHISQFYQDFDDDFLVLSGNESDSTVGSGTVLPCEWEGKTVTQKSPVKISSAVNGDNDFAFDVSEEWETGSQLSAEELFDGGVIKAVPLYPPPPLLQLPLSVGLISEKETFASPIRQTRKMIQGAFSPRGKSKKEAEDRRGRERSQVNVSKSYSRRGAARSLSPIRDNELYPWEEEKQQSNNNNNAKDLSNSSSSILCSSLTSGGSSKGGSKKWRLKDFFLFRSASEGRAADKDHLKNYTAAYRHSSFRSIDSPGSGSGSYKRGRISAHELHYTMNRAVSEDLKKRTFLPYKQGILGRLAFNPAVHALANGFGFSRN